MAENDDSNNCLTKAELANNIYESLPYDKHKATEIVEDWIELMKVGLERDNKVMLSGFGVFQVGDKAARPGRNPQTGERIILPARKVLRFKTSNILRRELNGGEDPGGHSGDDDEA